MKTPEAMLSRYLKVAKYIFQMDGDYVQIKQTLENQIEDMKKGFTEGQQKLLLGLEDSRNYLEAHEVETAFYCGFQLGAQLANEMDTYRIKLEEGEKRMKSFLNSKATGMEGWDYGIDAF